jgi:hypothetical protein
MDYTNSTGMSTGKKIGIAIISIAFIILVILIIASATGAFNTKKTEDENKKMTPSVLTPAVLTTSTATPSVLTPSTTSPSTVTPSTAAPAVVTPATVTPSVLTPAVNNITATPPGTTGYTVPAGINYVLGYSGGSFDNFTEQGQTPEACIKKALENKDKYSAWGYRTPTHPESKLSNTCFLYKKPFLPYTGDNNDKAHVTGCLNPNEKVEWGCNTTAPVASVFMPNRQPIKSRQNNECIDVYQASTNNEVGVDTYGCTNNDNQKWTYDSKKRLIAAHSGKCLTVTGGQDARPVQRDCTDGNGQKWNYEPSTQRIISVDKGLCLDRPGNGRITMWECHNGDNQKWYL